MKFRKWFKVEENCKERVNSIIDEGGYILFFEKENEIYGATEDSRVVFAKIKNPDEELPDNWDDEASFSAYNINKKLEGEPGEQVFYKKDLKKIKVINREEAIEKLIKVAKNTKEPKNKIKIDIRKMFEPDKALNFITANER